MGSIHERGRRLGLDVPWDMPGGDRAAAAVNARRLARHVLPVLLRQDRPEPCLRGTPRSSASCDARHHSPARPGGTPPPRGPAPHPPPVLAPLGPPVPPLP